MRSVRYAHVETSGKTPMMVCANDQLVVVVLSDFYCSFNILIVAFLWRAVQSRFKPIELYTTIHNYVVIDIVC